MKRALIQPLHCTNCEICSVQQCCPMTAVFRETPNERPWVDFYRCSGCLKCMGECPSGAVEAISRPCDGKLRAGW